VQVAEVAPTRIRSGATPPTGGPPVPAVIDPLSTLIGAVEYAADLTDGWSGEIANWEDLIADEIAPNLRFDDQVDLFVPTLFAVDPDARAGLPRRLVRALGVARAGATVALADRLVCAGNAGSWSARHFSLSVAYRDIRQVDEVEYTEDGVDFDALEIRTDDYVWPILFSRDADLRMLRRLLTGRIRGWIRPGWRDGNVERWLVHDGGTHWRPEPGWRLDDEG
jgi:hypothetical protein